MSLTFEERTVLKQLVSDEMRTRVPAHLECEWCCDDFWPDGRHRDTQRFCTSLCQKRYWAHVDYWARKRAA